MTMYIYVEYKSTLSDSVLALMHKPMPHVSIVNDGLKSCHSVGDAT